VQVVKKAPQGCGSGNHQCRNEGRRDLSDSDHGRPFDPTGVLTSSQPRDRNFQNPCASPGFRRRDNSRYGPTRGRTTPCYLALSNAFLEPATAIESTLSGLAHRLPSFTVLGEWDLTLRNRRGERIPGRRANPRSGTAHARDRSTSLGSSTGRPPCPTPVP
jgi:hypothetical protein